MSTLPFLLSVADELDNINSQSYMDDFGLGFHPHRQYYRTPTIQLSLPASTDWMQHEQRQRFRPHKFYDETQNNLQTGTSASASAAAANASATGDAYDYDAEDAGGCDGDDDGGDGDGGDGGGGGGADGSGRLSCLNHAYVDKYGERYSVCSGGGGSGNGGGSGSGSGGDGGGGPSTSSRCRQKYASALNSNVVQKLEASGVGGSAASAAARRSKDDGAHIDNSVQMYNLSKKCCKNYHRHGGETQRNGRDSRDGHGYRLHSKCMEGNNSSSDESLQKATSSIEFLTCFLLKKSRASKNTSGAECGSGSGGSGASGGSGKKS